ncbi:MAG TPA: tetratricopeptide repeat protein [Terriglobia bacterium]|nr:tetratricopeptide repeat protein [Terriglobia bacterium]
MKRLTSVMLAAGVTVCVLFICVHLRAAEVDQAVKDLRKQVKADPSNADLHYKLGLALSNLGRFDLQRFGKIRADADFDEAIKEYKRTLELQPARVEAHRSLASELAFKGKLAEARDQLREIAKLEPDDAAAHLDLARADLHDEGGDLNEAIAELRTALEKDPGIPGAWNNLGEAQMRAGKFDDAAAAYRETLKQTPKDDTAHFSLGEALKRAGKIDEAANEYREAVRLNDQWKDALSVMLSADLAAKNLAFAQGDVQVLDKLGYAIDPQLLDQLKSLQGK